MTKRAIIPAGGFIDGVRKEDPQSADVLSQFSMQQIQYAILYHNTNNHAETCRLLGIAYSTGRQDEYKDCVAAVKDLIQNNPEDFSKALFSALGPFFAMELFSIASSEEVKPQTRLAAIKLGLQYSVTAKPMQHELKHAKVVFHLHGVDEDLWDENDPDDGIINAQFEDNAT